MKSLLGSKAKGRYMFEKFDEIRNASAEYFGPDDGRISTSEDVLNELMNDPSLGINSKGLKLIEGLSKRDLIELTGIMFYSRAVVRTNNRKEKLEETTQLYAHMANDERHAADLSQKPLHKSLAEAEAKLNGEHDELDGGEE
jgi:hypothetical protein